MIKPQMIWRTIEDIRYDLEGSLDQAISLLTDRKQTYEAQGWTQLTLDIDARDDYGSALAEVEIQGYRMETQEEANQRAAASELVLMREEQKERKQFETLKAKYDS